MKQIALTLPGVPTQINNPEGFRADTFSSLGGFLSSTYEVLFTIAAFLMFLWLVWGAFEYIFAGGDKEKLGKAQRRLTWAIVGFIFVVVSFTVSQYFKDVLNPNPNQTVTPITVPEK